MRQLNPYTRLLNQIRDFCYKNKHRKKVKMWTYPKAKLDTHWSMPSLYERVSTAQQLGYEVVLIATEEGLEVFYREDQLEIPFEFRY